MIKDPIINSARQDKKRTVGAAMEKPAIKYKKGGNLNLVLIRRNLNEYS
jgi:hypothetical protein